MNFLLNRGKSKTMNSEKIVAPKKYKMGDVVCKTTWSESVKNKNFSIPKLVIEIKPEGVLSDEDMFDYVGLVGKMNLCEQGISPNIEAHIDYKKQLVTFVACQPIKKGEELIYNLHISCFNNVKIR